MHRERRFAAGAAAEFAGAAAPASVAPEQIKQRKVCLEPFDIVRTQAIAGIITVFVGARTGTVEGAFGKRRHIIISILIDAGVAR